MTAIYDYRLAFSTITKAALLANPAYNIENWTVPDDVPSPAYSWTEPHRELTTRPVPARVTLNADLSSDFDGFYGWRWGFKYWTFGQMAQLLDEFGDPNAYTVASLPVTVQTFVDNDYVAYQAFLARPVWGVDYHSEDGGYRDVLLKFTAGVIIT